MSVCTLSCFENKFIWITVGSLMVDDVTASSMHLPSASLCNPGMSFHGGHGIKSIPTYDQQRLGSLWLSECSIAVIGFSC